MQPRQAFRFGRLVDGGMQPANPRATYTLAEHIMKGSRAGFKSQYLSCSLSLAGIVTFLAQHIISRDHNVVQESLADYLRRKQKERRYLVEIEPSAVTGRWLDPQPFVTGKYFDWVLSQQEVTLEGSISHGAVLDKGYLFVRNGSIYMGWVDGGYWEPVNLTVEARLLLGRLEELNLLGQSVKLKRFPDMP